MRNRELFLRRLLVDAGYKNTSSRMKIVSLIGKRATFTTSEILEEISRIYPEIGRATVFRTLDTLLSLGALDKVKLSEGKDGYIVCGPPHHHHIVCTECGKIGEVNSDNLEEALEKAVEKLGFELRYHSIEISGLCESCRTASQTQKR